MPKILEALKTERDRKSVADFNIVHMYKSGQFYTAYDWSAWLIKTVVCTEAFHRVGYFDRDMTQFFLRCQ